MSYLSDYHSWDHAHKQAIYMRDHDAATRSRIVYAVTNDRLTRDTAKNVFELIDDLQKSDAENSERVTHILGMRPTATESASKLKLEAAAPDLLAALEAILEACDPKVLIADPDLLKALGAATAAIAKAKRVTP